MKFIALIIAPKGGYVGIGTLKNPSNGIASLSKIISMAVGVMTIVAVIWFVFIFITGAISIMSAGGDKQALESAQKRITTGIIGLVVVIISLILISLIGKILGVDLLNLSSLFSNILK